jgi:hypothetical protein
MEAAKFFTKELWLSAQNPNNLKAYDRDWQRAYEEYRAELETLKPRLAIEAYKFFAEADVHDGELLDLVVADGSRPAPLPEKARPWTEPGNYPVQVRIEVLDSYDKLVWHLWYKNVRRLIVDFPTQEPLFYSAGEGFGDWGYHELSDAGSGFLRHEVLFATGAILLFEFKELDLSFSARQTATS